MGLIPGQGNKIQHVAWHGQKNKIKNKPKFSPNILMC